MENRDYYDTFAANYETERHHGYHKMLDDLEVELLARYGAGKSVLEVGCGTGLILDRARGFASRAVGIDLSGGMLQKARARDLRVGQASATELPFPDASFDVAYSYKVLAHIPDIRSALAEMSRVVRPSGFVLAEFYNTRSLRYLVKRLKPPTPIAEQTTDEAVFTRYDSQADIKSYLPSELEWRGCRGVRVATPVSKVHDLPVVGPWFGKLEKRLADAPLFRDLGGFLIAILQKRP